jgi:phosphohistidine phosphatase
VRRLLLLRHAKAVPGDTKTEDHDRALNSRGQGDSALMGAEMHHRAYIPDLALCSTSRRTVETWDRLAAEFDSPPKSQLLSSLYLASPKSIIKLVQTTDDGVETLLVLGHNPGLEACAAALARKPETQEERALCEIMREKFPTCALAVLGFDAARWRDIEPGTGILADFIRPKDLKSE